MRPSLTDQWLFADDFVESHVCLIGSDALTNLDEAQTSKFQVIVKVNESEGVSGQAPSDGVKKQYHYELSAPFTAMEVNSLLNIISTEVDFKALNEKNSDSDKESEQSMEKFKATFLKIRSKLFGEEEKEERAAKQDVRFEYIKKITKKLQPEALIPNTIVLLGSPGSGKTTAISTVSEGVVLNSDVSATDSVANDKAKTTVGIDYAMIDIGEKRKVKLFGTPGQVKFNYVWDMVGKNADAFVILLDMSRPEPLSYLRFYKDFLANEFSGVSQVHCALTHSQEYKGDISLVEKIIRTKFTKLKGIHVLDGREKTSVLSMIKDIYPKIEMEYLNKHANHTINAQTAVVSVNVG